MRKQKVTILLILLSLVLIVLFFNTISAFISHNIAVTFYDVGTKNMTKARANYIKNNPNELNIAMLGSWEVYQKNGFILTEALELAAKEINAQGGVLNRKINLIWYDDNNSSGLAQEYAEDIINDPKIFAVIGPLSSGRVNLLNPLFSHNSMLEIAPLAQSTELDAFSPTLFMPISSTLDESKAMAKYAQDNNLDDFLMINNDGLFATNYANELEQEFFDADLNIYGRILFDRDSKKNYIRDEVNQYIAYFAIKNIIYISKIGDSLNFLKEQEPANLEFKGNIFFNGILPLTKISKNSKFNNKILLPQLLELNDATKPVIEKFSAIKEFQKEFHSLLCYRALYILANAIQQAQTLELAEIQKVLNNNELTTPLGKVKFNKNNFISTQNIEIITLEELSKRWESMTP